MKYRRFTQDFKRSLIEQLLSETVTPLELCRRYHISSGQLYTWKRHYAQGKLDPEPSWGKCGTPFRGNVCSTLGSMCYQKYRLTSLTTMYILGININFKGEGQDVNQSS